MKFSRFDKILSESIQLLALQDTVDTARMIRLFQIVLEYNSHTNLTRIVGEEDAAIKHFADSLSVLLADIPSGASLIDIGSGGGFPGLVLAIARPDLHVTLLDATAKKTTFIATAAMRLGLDNTATITGRAESEAHNPRYREQFDVVVWRGFGSLRISVEVCMPYTRVGGIGIAMKGPKLHGEISEAAEIIKRTGSEIGRVLDVPLPGDLQHKLLLLHKVSMTPDNYPGDWSKIKKG